MMTTIMSATSTPIFYVTMIVVITIFYQLALRSARQAMALHKKVISDQGALIVDQNALIEKHNDALHALNFDLIEAEALVVLGANVPPGVDISQVFRDYCTNHHIEAKVSVLTPQGKERTH
jgi:hypothetical protein